MYTSKKLEVILKLSEVCNIECTYCYYFFSGDDRYKERPAYIKDEILDGLIAFINESYLNNDIASVQIDLHGGEPLMLGKKRFSSLCSQLKDKLFCPHRVCMTTNGILIDDEWVSIFSTHSVNVCVSIDGPERIHDIYRVDKRGRGTHAQTIAGFEKLQAASRAGFLADPAVLCVVNAKSDPHQVYNYLTKDLQARHLDFLMPDITHDTVSPEQAGDVAKYMCSLMNNWLADDDSEIHVRTFSSVLSLLVSGRSYLAGFGALPPLVMTVGTDGSVDTDDFLKPCGVDFISTGENIKFTSFDSIFRNATVKSVHAAISRIPDNCSSCEFQLVCRGGQATHRFSRNNHFNNKSVYCDAQFAMFRAGAKHLLATGVDIDLIAAMCSSTHDAPNELVA